MQLHHPPRITLLSLPFLPSQKLDSKLHTGPLQRPQPRMDNALDGLGDARMHSSVANHAVRAAAARDNCVRGKVVDKSDRATVEHAIDPRTRMVRAGSARCHGRV